MSSGPTIGAASPSPPGSEMLSGVVLGYVRYAPILVFLIVLCACNVDFYIVNLHTPEIGIVLNSLVFFFLAVVAPIDPDQLLWRVLVPGFCVLAAMLTWSVVFQVLTGYSFVPSFLALRFWSLILIGPSLYMSYRVGVDPDRLARAFVYAIFCAGVILLGVYFSGAASRYANSSNPEVRRLVDLSDWRGLRLIIYPYAEMTFGIIYVVFLWVRQRMRLTVSQLPFVVALLVVYAYSFSRFITAALVASFLAYALVFHRWKRSSEFSAIFVCATIALGVAAVGIANFLLASRYASDPSFVVRNVSLLSALLSIVQHPVFGAGQDSNYSLSFRDIYGATFSPGDLGIVGTLFQFGVVGVVAYLALLSFTLRQSLRARFAHPELRDDAFVPALAVYMIFVVIISAVSTMATDEYGAVVTGCVLGFSWILLDRSKRPAGADENDERLR